MTKQERSALVELLVCADEALSYIKLNAPDSPLEVDLKNALEAMEAIVD